MKNLFLALSFVLLWTFAIGNELNTKDFNSNNNLVENKVSVFILEHTCTVEDGHYRGVGTGRTDRQACRRARRDLRRQLRDDSEDE